MWNICLKHAREKTYLNGLVNGSQSNGSDGKINIKKEEICKISIFPLTHETLDPKYHSRHNIKILESKSDYEQTISKFFTGLLINKIHHMHCRRLTCVGPRPSFGIILVMLTYFGTLIACQRWSARWSEDHAISAHFWAPFVFLGIYNVKGMSAHGFTNT
jgi:hypothetical protein